MRKRNFVGFIKMGLVHYDLRLFCPESLFTQSRETNTRTQSGLRLCRHDAPHGQKTGINRGLGTRAYAASPRLSKFSQGSSFAT